MESQCFERGGEELPRDYEEDSVVKFKTIEGTSPSESSGSLRPCRPLPVLGAKTKAKLLDTVALECSGAVSVRPLSEVGLSSFFSYLTWSAFPPKPPDSPCARMMYAHRQTDLSFSDFDVILLHF